MLKNKLKDQLFLFQKLFQEFKSKPNFITSGQQKSNEYYSNCITFMS